MASAGASGTRGDEAGHASRAFDYMDGADTKVNHLIEGVRHSLYYGLQRPLTENDILRRSALKITLNVASTSSLQPRCRTWTFLPNQIFNPRLSVLSVMEASDTR